MMYANISDYRNICNDEASNHEIETALKKISLDIDILTYNRIISKGFENLTPFQKEAIKEAACYMAQFQINYGEMIDMPYQNYSINGVSMGIGRTDNVTASRGVMLPTRAYEKLVSTGLCCGVL